jgi:hypothetical protein
MGTTVSVFIAENGLWLVIAVLAVNLLQRKHTETSQRKRLATLFWAVLALGLFAAAVLIIKAELSDPFLLIYAAAAALIVVYKRPVFLPFRRRCASCETPLKWNEIIFHDSNLCSECREDHTPP